MPGLRRFSSEKTRTKMFAYTMYEADGDLVTKLAEHFGCSKSEIVRNSVRHFYAHLAFIEAKSEGMDLTPDTLNR